MRKGVDCVGTAGLGALYISYFRSMCSTTSLALQLWFSPWCMEHFGPVLRGVFTSSNDPWAQNFLKAPLCGGEEPRAIHARKKCGHVAKKLVRTPNLGRFV